MKAKNTLKLLRDISLPLKTITQRLAFLGVSGTGKTYAAMKLAELMFEAGAQLFVVDPVGVWWGLRLDRDGRSKGLNIYIFGGERADVPITPQSGAAVAELLVRTGISAIIDISDFTLGGQYEFVIGFAEALYDAQRAKKNPIHGFWEEAHTFVPEKAPPEPKVQMMGHRVERVVRVGRNRGIGTSLISQFPQSVNKRCLNNCETAFVFACGAKHERKAVTDWFDSNMNSGLDLNAILPTLDTGQCIVASPRFLKLVEVSRVVQRETYDSSATPEFGGRTRRAVVKLLAVDVEQLRGSMAEELKEAEANQPEKLKARIAELEKAVKEGKTAKSALVREKALQPLADFFYNDDKVAGRYGDDRQWGPIQTATYFLRYRRERITKLEAELMKLEEGLKQRKDKGSIKVLERMTSKLAKHNDELKVIVERFARQRDALAQAQQVVASELNNAARAFTATIDTETKSVRDFIPEPPWPKNAPQTQPLPPGDYTIKAAAPTLKKNGIKHTLTEQFVVAKGEHAGTKVQSTSTAVSLVGKMVDMLAALKTKPLSRDDLATVVGMVPGSGGFNNYIGKLKSAGLVVVDGVGGDLKHVLTASGHRELGFLEHPHPFNLDLDVVVNRHGSNIVGKMKAMVQAVRSSETKLTRDQLADAVEMARGSGGFNNYIGKLKGRGIIMQHGPVLGINPVLLNGASHGA